jgi:hypothetical protein
METAPRWTPHIAFYGFRRTTILLLHSAGFTHTFLPSYSSTFPCSHRVGKPESNGTENELLQRSMTFACRFMRKMYFFLGIGFSCFTTKPGVWWHCLSTFYTDGCWELEVRFGKPMEKKKEKSTKKERNDGDEAQFMMRCEMIDMCFFFFFWLEIFGPDPKRAFFLHFFPYSPLH